MPLALGLRLAGDLVESEDGRARHARLLEAIQDICARERSRDGRECVEELRAMGDARRIVREARVARQAGDAQRLARLREERIRRGGDHDPGIAGGEGLVRADHRGARALGLRHFARAEVLVHLEDAPGQRRLVQRRRHVRAASGAVALAQRAQDGDGRPHPRAHVHDGNGHARGRLARMPVDGHDAAQRLHERVVARAIAERSFGAEGRDRAVDEPRIDRMRALPAEPQLLDGARAQRLDEDVGAGDEPLDDGAPLGLLHVHGEAPLVAVDAHEGGALLAPVGRRPGARVVAAPRALHLDHLGPHVAQDLGAGGAGDVLGQVGDEKSGQRGIHGSPIIARGRRGRRRRRGSPSENSRCEADLVKRPS